MRGALVAPALKIGPSDSKLTQDRRSERELNPAKVRWRGNASLKPKLSANDRRKIEEMRIKMSDHFRFSVIECNTRYKTLVRSSGEKGSK